MTPPPGRRPKFPFLSLRTVLASVSILGLISLSIVCGAAIMFFRLPSSDFFNKAFAGARAWYERGHADEPPRADLDKPEIRIDEPAKTDDGFTLYTSTAGPRARLIDMRGGVVHRWAMPFRKAWPKAPHIKNPLPDDQIHWFRCHLYPNGDLLAVYHAEGDTPYGYGLVKLDKDSKLLWAYSGHAHHDIDVEEDGKIYTLGQKLLREPPAGLESLPAPLIAESLVILSPDGTELENIPLLEAFRDSPYAHLLLACLDVPPKGLSSPGDVPRDAGPGNRVTVRNRKPVTRADLLRGDVVHANSVKVLRRSLALKFPRFKPGQVLVSLRSPSLIAVVDISTRSVVWAARGCWQAQHHAEFLPNGHILLYDNVGSMYGTRVVEYDPRTQALPWVYAGENSLAHKATSRGMQQRLPGGNTLIVNPEHGTILEVTAGKELVWQCRCGGTLTGAGRYRAADLTFLKGGARARP